MKGSDHKAITSKAIEIFCANFPSSLATKIADHDIAIAAASQDEDTSPIFTRATNWHFYKANEYLQPRHYTAGNLHTPFMIHPTSEEIYSYWVKQFGTAKKAGEDEEFFDRLGRILHHVQDMSTPAHVVPVYHGLSVKDRYEGWLHERIDERLAEITLSPSEIAALKTSGTADFLSIYGDAATAALDLLKGEFPLICDGANVRRSWSLFWVPFDPHTSSTNGNDEKYGFGSFGPLGDDFGDAGPISRQGSTYRIEPSVYEGLLATLLNKMLRESIHVLRRACA